MGTPTLFAELQTTVDIQRNTTLTEAQKQAQMVKLGFEQTGPTTWEKHTGATPSQILAVAQKAAPIVAPVLGALTTAAQNVASSYKGLTGGASSPSSVNIGPMPAPKTGGGPASSGGPYTGIVIVGAAILLILLIARR